MATLTIELNPNYHWGTIILGVTVPTKQQDKFKSLATFDGEIEFKSDKENSLNKNDLYTLSKKKSNVDFELMLGDHIRKAFNKPKFTGMIEVVISVTDLPKRIKKVDVDNLAKTILDSLKGVVFEDDNQVFFLTVHKHIEESDIERSLIIAIREMRSSADSAHPIKLFNAKTIE